MKQLMLFDRNPPTLCKDCGQHGDFMYGNWEVGYTCGCTLKGKTLTIIVID